MEFLAALGLGLGLSAGGIVVWLINLLLEFRKIRYQARVAHEEDFRLHNLNRQAEAYNSIWISINDFHRIFDALWESVDEEGIKRLAESFAAAEKCVRNASIILPPSLSKELKKLLHIVKNYQFGKTRLLEIRDMDGHLDPRILEDMERFTQLNYRYKEELNAVMQYLTEYLRETLYPGDFNDLGSVEQNGRIRTNRNATN